MNWTFVLFIALFLLIYGLINIYIGSRGWQYLFKYVPYVSAKAYWLFLGLAVSSLFLARIAETALPSALDMALAWTSSYWMGILYYAFLLVLLLDLLRFAGRKIPGFARVKWYHPLPGVIAFGMIALALGYGTWNANHPRVVRYDLEIERQAGEGAGLHLVLVSDLHLDRVFNEKRILPMVEKINEIDPDLVVLAGDTIDGTGDVFTQDKIGDEFRKLHPRLGVYAVLGNHEYYSGLTDIYIHEMEAAGIKVLRDQAVLLSDSFYLIGREDEAKNTGTEGKRLSLAEILSQVDTDHPIILLDHQPNHLDEAEMAGIDLQMSGHTHRGQFFPNELITGKIFEDDWGYLRKGDLQVIVTSGLGTWGPPIRIGNQPEIVDIYVKFVE